MRASRWAPKKPTPATHTHANTQTHTLHTPKIEPKLQVPWTGKHAQTHTNDPKHKGKHINRQVDMRASRWAPKKPTPSTHTHANTQTHTLHTPKIEPKLQVPWTGKHAQTHTNKTKTQRQAHQQTGGHAR